MNWQKTCERYVAYIDLPGFKGMAVNDTHTNNLKKIEILKKATENPENIELDYIQKMRLDIESDKTKSLILLDSIILFSKGSSIEDFVKIIADSFSLRKSAIINKIPIRIVISYGTITIDFDRFLYWGQPIVDAHLLLKDLFFLSIVIDHNAEKKVNSYKENKIIKNFLQLRKAEMEFGSVKHTIVNAAKKEIIEEDVSILKKLYNVTSAEQRFYIDNTIDYYQE